MSTASMILLLMVVGGATSLFRYSMIGLFANRNLPTCCFSDFLKSIRIAAWVFSRSNRR